MGFVIPYLYSIMLCLLYETSFTTAARHVAVTTYGTCRQELVTGNHETDSYPEGPLTVPIPESNTSQKSGVLQQNQHHRMQTLKGKFHYYSQKYQ